MATTEKKQESSPLLGAVLSALPRVIRAMQWNRPAEALGELAPLIAEARGVVGAVVLRPLEQTAKELEARAGRGRIDIPQGLLSQVEPLRGLSDLYLDASLRDQALRFIKETQHANALHEFHCSPRHTLLLSGPPRNGKTSLAEALASELSLPFLVVNPAAMMESHLGDSSRNIDKVFAFAATMPCLLFFDEVDTFASHRGSDRDVGEVARTTNTLLQRLDRLPPDCIFIAATNRREDLDPAFIGRMQLHIHVPLPSQEVLLAAAHHQLRKEITPGVDLSNHAEAVVNTSAENVARIIQACEDLRRAAALQKAGVALGDE